MKEFNKAIQIIRNLINTGKLDSLNLRMAYTELISMYSNSGQSYLKIQNDIGSGISHFKKAFDVFKYCVRLGIVDVKMVKNFCDSLHTFMNVLPPTEIENNRDYIRQIIENNEKQIRLIINSNRKIILKFSEKFEDDSLNYLIDYHVSEGEKVGNIIKTAKNDSYVFIDSENDRYFAHITDFPGIETIADFKKIKEGQLVTFEEGHNNKGVCAKNIKIFIS